MSNQKVCDGCSRTERSETARGEWARLFVPTDLFMLGRRQDDERPEFDLCPMCFRSIQSILTALPSAATSSTE